MKTAAFSPDTNLAIDAPASSEGFGAAFSRALAGFKAYAADRRLRRDMAALDSVTLRDMGVDADEIARIQSCEDYTPRAWRA